ncbi:acyltransferase family protein [Neptuniibacter halophilus]|uniref:acyltransferase family protein n=1 Tax=Neptuniibacter halophilus TaxID=651666 RepID=UPI0025730615|nr:acyltransferase family protein [Neptuniibacter halophilus]
MGVVFFHAGFDWAEGGYAGVDIFFVLSGFLITNSILQGVNKGQFSLFDFYTRRFFRIIPATIAVIAITFIFANYILFPEEMKDLAESALAFFQLKSNFWAANSIGYFDIGVEYKPFVHFWSLSVELQFYLVFPLLIIFVLRKGGDAISLLIFVLIFLLSLTYASISVYVDQNESYFSTVMRAWQFCLGIMVSIYLNKTSWNRHISSKVILIASYVLIVISFYFFDSESRFPGLNALLPCIATALIIILGGSEKKKENVIINSLVYVGRTSFSIYLVHQPIFSIYRTILSRDFNLIEQILAVVISLIAGFFLFHLVEERFKYRGSLGHKVVRSTLVISLNVFLCAWAFNFYHKPSEDYIYSDQVAEFLSFRYDNNPRVAECRVSNRVINPEDACVYGGADLNKVAIWGDSHVDQLVFPLSKDLEKRGYSLVEFSIAGCPPITDIKSPSGVRRCSENSKAILAHLISNKEINYVILHAYWTGYFDKNLIFNTSESKSIDESFRFVISSLLQAGKKVYVIDPVPNMNVNPPLYMARHARFRDTIDIAYPSLTVDEFRNQSLKAMKFLESSSFGLPVDRIDIAQMLFNSADEAYLSGKDGIIFYRDDNHLSVSGASYISDLLTTRILGAQSPISTVLSEESVSN